MTTDAFAIPQRHVCETAKLLSSQHVARPMLLARHIVVSSELMASPS